MRNVWIIIKHEITSMLGKRSFWIMTFLFPLLILGLNVGMQVVSRRAIEQERLAAQSAPGRDAQVGYVDPGDLIVEWPASVPDEGFQRYPDEAAAQAVLEAGEIASYYLIPVDLVERGEAVLVDRVFKPFAALAGEGLFEHVIRYNLVGDERLARLVRDPTPRVERQALAPKRGNDREDPLTSMVPYVAMLIFFLSLTMSSGFLLQSVSKEKETRAAEVLLLSLRPRELMLGKVVGLGLIALCQLAIWASGGLLFLGRGEQLVAAASSFTLPPGFLGWLLLYFLFGYATYASAMAAVGVLAPTAREGGQFTFLIMLPLMIPLWLNNVFIQKPHGPLATALSLFPLTAPLSMITRLAVGGVPLWQPVVGVLALAATAYLFVLLSARLYRADTLLSSASLSWGRLWRELRGHR